MRTPRRRSPANLDTEGDATKFAAQNIYVDTMVNFVVSEDDPSFADMDDVKIAVFANATSNLVIRHGVHVYVDEEIGWDVVPTNTVTEINIDPEDWYRLTVTLKTISFGDPVYYPRAVCQVQVNGTTVQHPNAYESSWFLSMVMDNQGTLDESHRRLLQGTGFYR